jgi:hypothetical protein
VLIERAGPHLGKQTHPPDHVTAGTPQIDVLSLDLQGLISPAHEFRLC